MPKRKLTEPRRPMALLMPDTPKVLAEVLVKLDYSNYAPDQYDVWQAVEEKMRKLGRTNVSWIDWISFYTDEVESKLGELLNVELDQPNSTNLWGEKKIELMNNRLAKAKELFQLRSTDKSSLISAFPSLLSVCQSQDKRLAIQLACRLHLQFESHEEGAPSIGDPTFKLPKQLFKKIKFFIIPSDDQYVTCSLGCALEYLVKVHGGSVAAIEEPMSHELNSDPFHVEDAVRNICLISSTKSPSNIYFFRQYKYLYTMNLVFEHVENQVIPNQSTINEYRWLPDDKPTSSTLQALVKPGYVDLNKILECNMETTNISYTETINNSNSQTHYTSNPDTTNTSNQDARITSNPKTSNASNPDTVITSMPGTSIICNPDTNNASHPNKTDASHPNKTDASNPNKTDASNPNKTYASHPNKYSDSNLNKNDASSSNPNSASNPDKSDTSNPDKSNASNPDNSKDSTPDTNTTFNPETSDRSDASSKEKSDNLYPISSDTAKSVMFDVSNSKNSETSNQKESQTINLQQKSKDREKTIVEIAFRNSQVAKSRRALTQTIRAELIHMDLTDRQVEYALLKTYNKDTGWTKLWNYFVHLKANSTGLEEKSYESLLALLSKKD